MKDFFSKCDQIHSFVRIWSHLMKSLKENFIFFCNIAPDTVRQVFTFEHSSRKGSKPENYRQICLFSIVEFVWTLSNVVMKLGIIHLVFTIKSRFKAKETPEN